MQTLIYQSIQQFVVVRVDDSHFPAWSHFASSSDGESSNNSNFDLEPGPEIKF